jgi:hypothetical protein
VVARAQLQSAGGSGGSGSGSATARNDGQAATAAALAEAVRRGVRQESGFYGAMLVGVYSNADLAANYAGLKLYLNLTRPVRVGNYVRPALFILSKGQWVANIDALAQAGPVRSVTGPPSQRRADGFLRPFVSDHFNEALNPSRYKGPTRRTIRTRWQARAASWVAFYGSTRDAEAARLQRLATWHGEPYGHSAFDELVTAPDTCFDGAVPTPRPPRSSRRPTVAAPNVSASRSNF